MACRFRGEGGGREGFRACRLLAFAKRILTKSSKALQNRFMKGLSKAQ